MSLKNNKLEEVRKQFEEYSRLQSEECSIRNLTFFEKSSYTERLEDQDVSLDWVYTIQHQFCLRWFIDALITRPQELARNESSNPYEFGCLDVGSSIPFISVLSALSNYAILDASLCKETASWTLGDAGMCFIPGEAQNLPFEDRTFVWITSMHAIEHFGLGRYRDTIDPMGDIRGLEEMHRVLRPNGIFVGAVPIVKKENERIKFNRSRLYAIDTVKSMLDKAGFVIEKDVVIIAPTDFLTNEEENNDPALFFQSHEFENAMSHDIDNIEPDAVFMWQAKRKN